MQIIFWSYNFSEKSNCFASTKNVLHDYLSLKNDKKINFYHKKNHYQHFQYGDKYWYFLLGILCLGLEGLHSLCKRRGEELKWVCPSIFIYLASIGKKHAFKK